MTFESDRALFVELIQAYEEHLRIRVGLSKEGVIEEFVDRWMDKHHIDNVLGIGENHETP